MLQYEMYHLDVENRMNKNYLEILHDKFIEFGQSGVIYNKKDLEQLLLNDEGFTIKDFNAQQCSEHVILCTYRLFNKMSQKESLRSSIWLYEDGRWQLLFHQGTKV